jgi:hypothetical protein
MAALLFATRANKSVATLVLIGLCVVVVPSFLALWPVLLHHRTDQVTLSLEPDVLRVTRRNRTSAETMELPRSEAGKLVRWVARPGTPLTARLQLEDRTGKVRVELIERDVDVRSWPFGMTLVPGMANPTNLPLDILLGGWWPAEGTRTTRVKRRAPLAGDPDEGPWNRPGLSEYAASRVRARAQGAVGLMGIGAMGLVLALVLLGMMVAGLLRDATLLAGIVGGGLSVASLWTIFLGYRMHITGRSRR